jgi:hypothetical protein
MESLMMHYKEKIELLRKETVEKIHEAEKHSIGEIVFILTGKMLAFDICLKELELMENFENESLINK